MTEKKSDVERIDQTRLPHGLRQSKMMPREDMRPLFKPDKPKRTKAGWFWAILTWLGVVLTLAIVLLMVFVVVLS